MILSICLVVMHISALSLQLSYNVRETVGPCISISFVDCKQSISLPVEKVSKSYCVCAHVFINSVYPVTVLFHLGVMEFRMCIGVYLFCQVIENDTS